MKAPQTPALADFGVAPRAIGRIAPQQGPIVSPGETIAYKLLVEDRFGVAGARDLLAVYFIPRMGHGGVEYDDSLSAQLDALEAWVDWRQSGGTAGSPPHDPLVVSPTVSYPRY